MKYFQFILDDERGDKLTDIIKRSGKSKQKFFEDMSEEVINCQKKRKN